MTSRNYLFNSIKENIRRNFYLLILISVSMLAVLPVYTIMRLENALLEEPTAQSLLSPVQQALLDCIGVGNPGMQILVICAAVLLALSGFSYLHAGEKADFYHSLPLKREELFMVSFSSGFFTFLIPYLVAAALTCLVGAVYGGVSDGAAVTLFQAMGIHILYFLVIYGVSVLAILLTGNLFTALLALLGMMSYGWLVFTVYNTLNNRFLYTIGYFGQSDIGCFLSPIISYLTFSNTVGTTSRMRNNLVIVGVILAVVFFIADICVYKIRPSESYHKAIAFQKLQPLIKVCCVVPIALLAGLFFSSGMKNKFIWMLVTAVAVGVLLSVAFEFLYTMDIQKCIRPRISLGVILGVLLVVLVGYKTDITGYDSYLPKKEEIETMSVYFPSINGRFSYNSNYYEDYGFNENSNFLKNMSTKNFENIYELAKIGVKACAENKKNLTYGGQQAEAASNVQGTAALGDTNETLVEVDVAYHLKSGKTVYRAYMIPENKKVVSNVAAVYDNWDYKSKLLPTTYLKAEDMNHLYLDNFYTQRKQVDVSGSHLEEIYKTYKTELENMTFQESAKNRIVGYLTAEMELTDQEDGTYGADCRLPIYENFTKTIQLLQEAGEEVPLELDVSQVQKLVISRWNEEGEEISTEIEDNMQKETLLKHLTFEEAHYGVDSHVEYDLNVSIEYKNSEYTSSSIYLIKDKSVEDILKKLNFD
ncbi:MAG TPA: ABC transporter permease [Candidatus Blautia stercoravium]|nr:ABC transporter permease [Candidatus Blautia stercoravium]